MSPAPDMFAWLLPAGQLAVALLACGAYLARTGFAGRRRGDTPHCARCDYIVGGLEKLRCPECGSDLNPPGAIIFGQRPRRRGRGMLGLVLVALRLTLGITNLTPSVRRIDEYQYKPTACQARRCPRLRGVS